MKAYGGMYRSTYSWPRQQKVSGHLHAPAALSWRKESRAPTWQEACWGPRTGLGNAEENKILPLRGSNSGPSTVQSVASRYACEDCGIWLFTATAAITSKPNTISVAMHAFLAPTSVYIEVRSSFSEIRTLNLKHRSPVCRPSGGYSRRMFMSWHRLLPVALRCALGVSNEPFFSHDEIDSRLLSFL
jgi:hypothetical protein